MIKIFLKKGKESSLLRLHPWIFSGAIASVEGGEPQDGDVVDVYTHEKTFIARGHCAPGSIAVRVLTFQQEEIDQQWWRGRIECAFQLRKAMGVVDSCSTTCYRLIHGEGDFTPGLIVDVYHNVAVIQAHSTGIHLSRHHIAAAIKEVLGDKIEAVYDKSEGTLSRDIETHDGFILGSSGRECEVLENGVKFNVNWHEGQKTGFFIDQRENRALVGLYSKGRRVLNTFCYTGGFSVYAAQGGAESVVSVDSSAKAVELACKNIELNFGENVNHTGVTVDAFDYLKKLEKGSFDLIILDPPAFAKHHKAHDNAMQGYKRINGAAIKNIAPGGILFTFSCSQAISKEQFRTAVFAAAQSSGRKVRILHQLTQPSDHPVSIYHPEGEYLKGLVLFVE